ncbi:MAG: prephenate dehydrogenase [Ferruginibacter sp.]|nr:prephenate dehydrogenase [Ferruginibacter sp.]MBU9936145.1 prephenate dehydrogenase [Ferruginibacter sp.]HQY11286.1 prephenate dehydrogenase [Ferruginibacter sp.]
MTVTIIGTGLIGCSMANRLRETGLARRIIGVDTNEKNLITALQLGWIDNSMVLDEAVRQSDLVIIAIPVDGTKQVLTGVLNKLDKQVLMDVGSTKGAICRSVAEHEKRGRYVATHPMWGTEKDGPESVVKDAFKGRVAVICEKDRTDADALQLVEELYTGIGMQLVYMDSDVHDVHAAYVSHISHIASYALSLTVLEKEKEEDAIFELASGGFESTVRLAKSNPAMWVPIFQQNKENVLDVLNEHIAQLRKIKSCLEKENYGYLKELIENANKIKRILK